MNKKFVISIFNKRHKIKWMVYLSSYLVNTLDWSQTENTLLNKVDCDTNVNKLVSQSWYLSKSLIWDNIKVDYGS